MLATDDEDYDDIADEDLIGALSQASQTLPPHHDKNDSKRNQRRRSWTSSGVSSGDEGMPKSKKKKKYKIHTSAGELPPAQTIGATQAERLPDSSPYRIRGPIYKKRRSQLQKPETESKPLPFVAAAESKPPPFAAAAESAPGLPAATRSHTPGNKANNVARDEDFARELEGLPSDAFSSPEPETVPTQTISLGSSFSRPPTNSFNSSFSRKPIASQGSFHQTTLFGSRAPEVPSATQARKVHNYKLDKPPELPTHHALDHEALQTWVYPTNLGVTRDYQYTIVRNGLFNNLLVALPTGLGKTFIAATIMLNYFRWTKDAQIVFMAPTKPLVSQQVHACFNIVGLPRSSTSLLTGEQAPSLRAEEWEAKRVFFTTPQTFVNDLSTGIADPKKVVLLVVDEAHKATGNYAYVKVVQFLRRFNSSFRVLALTATPGSNVEAVQDVINNLEISKIDIRTEESIDIQPFVHQRNVEQILLDPTDEMVMIKELLSKALQPAVNQLCGQNAYWNKDPMALTPYGLTEARKTWFKSAACQAASGGYRGMISSLFSVLASIAYAIKLLNFHGIGPFHSKIRDFLEGDGDAGKDGRKGGKYKNQIIESPDFKKMMERVGAWLRKPDFVGHPKLTYLCDTILNHFLDAGEGSLPDGAPPTNTRVIVFSEFRESAEDITRTLNKHGPMIRASVFVGQSKSQGSEGMKQSKQLETIQKFKDGDFNVIVATSIGEEGLDIGQVDLIVCYDASSSPIRMLQRMGRTGRKRAGKVVLLLMREKEEASFARSKDNYEQMQKIISSGERFAFRHDLSVRIVPKDTTPTVDKRLVDIPPENVQDPSLPEPKRRKLAKPRKKPPKKFHMPDGVETGFTTASMFTEDGSSIKPKVTMKPNRNSETEDLEPIPSLESVLLTPSEVRELEVRFLNVVGNDLQEVEMPDMTSQTPSQRSLLPTVNVPHGQLTKNCVRMFKILADSQRVEDCNIKPYGDVAPSEISWSVPPTADYESDISNTPTQAKKRASTKRKRLPKRTSSFSDTESDSNQAISKPARRHQAKLPALSISAAESDGEEEMGHLPASTESEGEGDDLLCSERRSDDDTELGSLKDFLATSSSPVLTRTRQSTRSSSPPKYDNSQPTTTQELIDEMPDIAGIFSRVARPVSRVPKGSDTDDLGQVSNRRGKRRRIVEDDSDDVF